MSQILAQTSTTVRADGAFSASGSWDRNPPDGFSINCLGLRREGSNPGTMGVIFAVNVPDGYKLNGGGSLRDPNDNGSGPFIRMVFNIGASSDKAATQNWEIWFNQSDVDSADWGLPMELQITSGGNTSSYTYRFRKGGSSDGHGKRH